MFVIVAAAAMFAPARTAYSAGEFPAGPIEIVCATSPGSGAAHWCQTMARAMSRPDVLGVPVDVVYKFAGSNHEAVLYTHARPADGHTLLHASGSFAGYFNLPHYTLGFDDFTMVARVERSVYGIAVRADSPWRSWRSLVDYARAHPGELVMGSNKLGSLQHRLQVALMDAAGIDVRFVPYSGSGGVVKDVLGGHLPIGLAQPGRWDPHIRAGAVRPLLLINEAPVGDPLWTDVPLPKDVGMDMRIEHQWQGFMVRAGTPPETVRALARAAEAATATPEYRSYAESNPHAVVDFVDDPQDLERDMRAAIEAARRFMIANNIIPHDDSPRSGQ